jgi:hypothetical protein
MKEQVVPKLKTRDWPPLGLYWQGDWSKLIGAGKFKISQMSPHGNHMAKYEIKCLIGEFPI